MNIHFLAFAFIWQTLNFLFEWPDLNKQLPKPNVANTNSMCIKEWQSIYPSLHLSLFAIVNSFWITLRYLWRYDSNINVQLLKKIDKEFEDSTSAWTHPLSLIELVILACLFSIVKVLILSCGLFFVDLLCSR